MPLGGGQLVEIPQYSNYRTIGGSKPLCAAEAIQGYFLIALHCFRSLAELACTTHLGGMLSAK